jgi:O-antigen/teichoic acid export membrane protein
MGDSWPLVALTMAYLSILALQAIQRGVAVGHDRFWPLFWQFGVDGALRLAIPALVAASGRGTPEVFALSVVISAGCGLLACQLALARSRYPSYVNGGPSSTGLDGKAVAALVVAAVGAQILANGAPPILSLIGRDTAAVLAGVVGALALTRLPLLFASAIQAPLLPPMVRLIRSGDTTALWRLLGRILAGFGALGFIAFLLGWFFGADLLRIYLGDDYGARPISMAMLTSAGVGLLAIVAVQAAVVAAGSNRSLVVSWGVGITAFFATTAFPVDGLFLAPIAVAIGTAVTLLALLVGLRRATR